MKLTQKELRRILIEAGLPATIWQLPDIAYETCSKEFVVKNWRAWLDARPKELVTVRHLGGGKTARVPLWEAESGDCDNLAVGTMAWASVGNALAAVMRKESRGGLAYGTQFFQAGPARKENFNIAGGHSINWHVAHDLAVYWFEPAVGEHIPLILNERSTAWFGLAI
mgnify:CR=1 FL=1